MDRIDKTIINLLQEDATISVGAIAEKVSISKTACWRRIQKLENDDVIRKRVVMMNAEKLNVPLTVFITIRTNQHIASWVNNFKESIEHIPEVTEIYRISGNYDYLLKAHVTDMPGYDALYKKLIKANLLDISASFVMEELKHSTALPVKSL
ncbi:MAG: Lrp/AsnC family transcriptional regulator [Arenicella sp.]